MGERRRAKAAGGRRSGRAKAARGQASPASATEAGANAGAAGHPPAPPPRAVPPQIPAPAPAPDAAATATQATPPPLAAPPSSSSTQPSHPWEIAARAWLKSFPDGRLPTEPEVDAYIDAHCPSLPRSQLHQRLLALRGDQVLDADQSAFPYRFQRTNLWKPVYKWLESLEMDSLVTSKQISEWFMANPQRMDMLVEKHSKYRRMKLPRSPRRN